MWLFAYGSIIWNPGFRFVNRVRAAAPGWARKFWQGSTDHRGTPSSPGRVVTLVESRSDSCHGYCYRIHKQDLAQVFAYLDHRESGGYIREQLTCVTDDGVVDALTYIAYPDNPNYLGETSTLAIASQILDSRGPSGLNIDYFVELYRSLKAEKISDPHLEAIHSKIATLKSQDKSQ